MINFKEAQIEDKSWVDPLIKASNFDGSHQNFGNIFTWAKISNFRVAKVNERLAVKVGKEEQGYFFPAGTSDVKPVIEEMIKDAADCGHEFRLYALTDDNIKVLNELYPGKFSYKKNRNAFDYVYRLDKMISLSGKKLHSKRNHNNAFKKRHQWSFELITKDNIKECMDMNEEWCKDVGCADSKGMKHEYCATRRYFKYFNELQVEGGLLRVEGKVVAFTIGEVLNSDTYIIHIEKAFRNVQGAYSMINREFAEYVKSKYPQLVYINREEDMGQEGLRKAKESYYPERMEVKYMAKFNLGD